MWLFITLFRWAGVSLIEFFLFNWTLSTASPSQRITRPIRNATKRISKRTYNSLMVGAAALVNKPVLPGSYDNSSFAILTTIPFALRKLMPKMLWFCILTGEKVLFTFKPFSLIWISVIPLTCKWSPPTVRALFSVIEYTVFTKWTSSQKRFSVGPCYNTITIWHLLILVRKLKSKDSKTFIT